MAGYTRLHPSNASSATQLNEFQFLANEFVRWAYGRATGTLIRLATVVSGLAG